jgi:hypothetical protein
MDATIGATGGVSAQLRPLDPWVNATICTIARKVHELSFNITESFTSPAFYFPISTCSIRLTQAPNNLLDCSNAISTGRWLETGAEIDPAEPGWHRVIEFIP